MTQMATYAPGAQKVLRLATLATNHAATEGESRNAAIAACRAIVTAPDDVLALAVPPGPHSEPRYTPPPTSYEPPRKVIRARYDGFCSKCATTWQAGERIAWAKGRGAVCVRCHWEAGR